MREVIWLSVTHYLCCYSMNSSTRAHESKPHMQKQITLEDSVHSYVSLQMLSWSLGKTQLSAIHTTMKQRETFLYLCIWCNKNKLGNNVICDRIRNHTLSVSLQVSTWSSIQHSVQEQSISNDILKFSMHDRLNLIWVQQNFGIHSDVKVTWCFMRQNTYVFVNYSLHIQLLTL